MVLVDDLHLAGAVVLLSDTLASLEPDQAASRPMPRCAPAAAQYRPLPARWLADAGCLLAIALVTWFFLAAPRFDPDCWSYLELSDSVGADFYRVSTLRQTQFDTPYGVSFPPLYPLMMAAARTLYDAGVYTGVGINALVAAATLLVLRGVARSLRLPWWAGSLAFLSLLLNVQYLHEMAGAGSLPLAVLLLALLLKGLLDWWPLRPWQAAVLAVLAALATLNRFDCLPVGVLLGGLVLIRSPGQRCIAAATYGAVFVLMLAPWMAYCQVHFGKPLASDNSRTATLAIDSYPLDYLPDQASLPTLSTAPRQWLQVTLTQKAPRVLASLVRAVTFESLLPLLALLSIAVAWSAWRCGGDVASRTASARGALLMAIAALWLLQAALVAFTAAEWGDLAVPTLLALAAVATATRLAPPATSPALPISTDPADAPVSAASLGQAWLATAFALLVAVQVPLLVTTGFKDRRYYIPLMLFATIALLAWLSRRLDLGTLARRSPLATAGVGLLLVVAVPVNYLIQQPAWPTWRDLTHIHRRAEFVSAAQYQPLVDALHASTLRPRVLVVAGVDAFRFGALTRTTTIVAPSNLDPAWADGFLRQFRVTHILDTEGRFLAAIANETPLAPTSFAGLMQRAAPPRATDEPPPQLFAPPADRPLASMPGVR